MLTRVSEIIEGNNLEEKVPFTSGCFCSMSILENALALRAAATLEMLSSRFLSGWLKDRTDAYRHLPFLFVRLFLAFDPLYPVKAHLPNLPLGEPVHDRVGASDRLTCCFYLQYGAGWVILPPQQPELGGIGSPATPLLCRRPFLTQRPSWTAILIHLFIARAELVRLTGGAGAM